MCALIVIILTWLEGSISLDSGMISLHLQCQKHSLLCGLLSGIRVEVTMFTDDANVLAFPSSGKVYWFSLYVENIWTSSA